MALDDWALSVGIDGYPGLTPLKGAEHDARAFDAWVRAHGVDAAHACLIVSSNFPAAPAPMAAQPTSQPIWDFFEKLRAAANANNAAGIGAVAGHRLYMFFSGHGFSPTIDTSAVLTANAEQDTPHNLSPKAWADRFYENGLFEQVLLFQDACREPADDVDITPPYLKKYPAGGANDRRRFYAMAAKSPLLAIEKDVGGVTRGIFSATLLEGLEGAARDPASGDVTSDSLAQYLRTNMAARLTPAELANEDFAHWPEVYGPEPLVIVPSTAYPAAPGGAPNVSEFPVKAAMPAGTSGQVLTSDRQSIRTTAGGPPAWDFTLPIGLYELARSDGSSSLFKVSGAIGAAGNVEVVNVA